jgi:cytoskeletal protein RodZ
MSDHEFEKQVHQKLEELKLRPSDTVWMEVEKSIRQRKRRRRFLWLWSAALMVSLTTSGIVLYHYYTNQSGNTLEMAQGTTVPASSSSNPTNNTISPNSTSDNNSNNTNTQSSPVQPDPQNAASTPGSEAIDVTPPAAAITQPDDNDQPGTIPPAAPILAPAGSNEKKQAIAITPKNNQITTTKTYNKKAVTRGSTTIDQNRSQTKLPSIGYNHEKQANKKNIVPPVNKQAKGNEPLDAVIVTAQRTEGCQIMTGAMPVIVHETEPIATSKAATEPFNNKAFLLMPDSASMNAAVAAMPIERKTPSLWHVGVKADVGYSRISVSKLFQLRGLFGTDKSYAEDLAARSYSSPNTTSSQFLSGNAAAAPPKKVASAIQPDFAASVGVYIQRTLSPRLKISVGLEYSYMSVNTQVGKLFDSSIAVNIGTNSLKVIPKFYESPGYIDTVRGTYANVQGQGSGWVYYSQKQRYRFHYVEIPVTLNWQINKGRRLPPFVFEGGFSVGRLFAVDALHYEGVKGVYYEDNSLFNKTQFNFVTGLSVGLMQRSKHPIWIGPDLRYSLNGLVKKEISTGQYLWSTGISFKMLLGRL